jgi:hypothetical protein
VVAQDHHRAASQVDCQPRTLASLLRVMPSKS